MGFKDSSFNPDSCAVCRETVCSKTRHGATLTEHFTSSKATVAPTTALRTLKRKSAPQGPRPRSLGPSAGSAGDAGAEKRVSKPTSRSKKKAAMRVEKEKAEDGGFVLEARGQARAGGLFVAAGEEHTCLADALWSAMKALLPQTKLSLQTVRASVPVTEGSDPNFTMAERFAQGYGAVLAYDRALNNPKALFNRREGIFLVQLKLEIQSEGAVCVDYHYVTYLAASGHMIDNHPRGRVPIVQDYDRGSNKRAIKVFKHLFPGACRITMQAVSELRKRAHTDVAADRKSRFTCGLLFEPASPKFLGYSPYWSSTIKPTHEDLFLELYDQKVINYDELVDCIK